MKIFEKILIKIKLLNNLMYLNYNRRFHIEKHLYEIFLLNFQMKNNILNNLKNFYNKKSND